MSPLSTKLQHTLSTHSGPINALTFSSLGGTYILSGSSDREIHLSRTLPPTSSTSTSTSTSTATTTTSSLSHLSSPPTSTTPIQKYAAHGYAILSLSCSADNQTFASAGGDRSVFLWDVSSAVTIRRYGGTQGHTSRVNTVTFAGEGDGLLVSGGGDTIVRIWDVRSRSAVPVMVLDDAADSITALDVVVGQAVVVSGSVDGRVRWYDIRSGLVRVDTMPAAVTGVQVTRDGEGGLVSTLDSTVRIMDARDGKCLRAFQGGRNQELRVQACFGWREAVVLRGEEEGGGRVRVWDVDTGKERGVVEAGEKVVSLVKWREKGSGGEEVWASAGVDGKVRVWSGI